MSAATAVPTAGIDSTQAISALAKEKIRMRAQRFQRGSLTLLKRKTQPDAWMFRYYTEEGGRQVYKRQFVGTVVEFPKRKDAELAVARLRVEINTGVQSAPLTIEALAIHYKREELPSKAYATIHNYTELLDNHIVPKWGECRLSSIKAVEVEKWLSGIKRRNGNPTSPATRAKIRNVMSAIFTHAIRYGWATHNPITAVRTSTQRLRDPEFLTPEEIQALMQQLPQRERVMVLLDATTGLRRGEMIALRWQDLDFQNNLANVTASIYRNVLGKPKTRASRKPVPLHPLLVEELKQWRAASPYKEDGDFVFASLQKNGAQPLQPDMLLKRHIRPALAEMGVKKRIGWHSFRHGITHFLRQRGIDVKIAQELLRHANSRITLDIYSQTVTEERRAAQVLAFSQLWDANTHSLLLSSNRTQTNPNDLPKEEVKAANC